MIEKSSTIRPGLLKRLHVDQGRIRSNKNHGTDLPPITVQAQGGPYKAHEIEIKGPSKLVYRDKPLSCGARLYIETTAEVETTVR